jgi:adenine-specific DNA-methyltransferase
VNVNADLHQWFTPRWVCEAIVDRYFRFLDLADSVIEPSCGDGRFLEALPAEVPAVGVEIDPAMAARAREASGRPVIAGDFLTVDIPGRFTHAIGNLPFDARLVHGFLARAHGLLEEGGLCGFLLPAYVLQTSSKVVALNRQWSIEQQLMPRNIFPRLSLPLVFAQFRKDPQRTLVGFFLYRECADVASMPRDVQQALQGPVKGSVWRQAVRTAFQRLGVAKATLEALYSAVERPSENRFWREKVRQVLQTYPEFRRAGAGTWQLAGEAA